MADYYSVIRRAVVALGISTFEDRRAIYNRARAAQECYLGKRPFNKSDFDRERLLLEDAISRVEAEATTKRIITYASRREPMQPKRHRPSFVSDFDDGVSPDITVISVADGPLRGRDTFTFTSAAGPVVGTGLPGLIFASGGLLAWWRRKRKVHLKHGLEHS